MGKAKTTRKATASTRKATSARKTTRSARKTTRSAGKRSAPQSRSNGRSALVIVESPAKARTIERYLGSGHVVKASMGHIRDLPENELGVNIDGGFELLF